MTIPTMDQRSAERRVQDEQLATEPRLAPLVLLSGAVPATIEAHFDRFRRRPVAMAGVVENGLVRPLDPTVKLPEHSRVIIVTSERM